MKEFHIPIRRSARYCMLGEINDDTRALWLVCHGYGQLASEFISAFKGLEDGHTAIVAPEGLSRFYLDGFYGRVGASWMTKEDRQAEIADQRNFLEALYRIVTHRLPDEAVINVLGFSQGTATAARWVAASRYRIDNLILWAGEFPRDLQEHDRFRKLHGYYVYGSGDPFIEDARVAETRSWFDAQGLRFEIKTFEGKHHLHTATLQELNRNMQRAAV